MRRTAIVLVLAALIAAPALGQQADLEALLRQAGAEAAAGRLDAAERAFEQAMRAATDDGERAHVLHEMAAAREGAGDRNGAISALSAALRLQDGGEWLVACLQRLGWLAERHGREDLAREAHTRLLEVAGDDHPLVGHALLSLAQAELDEGDHAAAITRLERLLAQPVHRGWHRQARDLLVKTLLGALKHGEALAAARAAEDASRRASLMAEVAQSLLGLGAMQQAEEIGWEILQLDPRQPQAMRLIYRAADRERLLQRLRTDADGDRPEDALEFIATIARWEDDAEGALEAWAWLAELRPDDPGTLIAFGNAALEANSPADAEQALREALRLRPDDQLAATSLGDALLHQGRTDEAVEQFKDSVGYNAADETSVRSLWNLLRRSSLHGAAIEAITEAREATGDPGLLAAEMARAYEGALQYEEAARELLTALGREDEAAYVVGIELERLARDEIAGEIVLRAVEEHIASADPAPVQRIALARVYFAVGMHDRAAGLLAEVPGAGAEIAEIARDARRRSETDLALRLFTMALTMDLPPMHRADVATELARLQAEAGDWREALATLDGLEQSPEPLLLRARLLTDRARRIDEAREAWQALEQHFGGEPRYALAAREGIAQCLFAEGRLDEAEQSWLELSAQQSATPWETPPLPPGFVHLPEMPGVPSLTPAPGDLAARAALRLAEIALRRGDFDAARERFLLVAQEHPRSDEANDALERVAFIRDNFDGDGRAEKQYLKARGLWERGEWRLAQEMLLEIAGTRDEPLADDALLLLAEMRAEQDDPGRAAETWLSVAERFPESLLAPEALLLAAEVLAGPLDEIAGATEALRRVVDEYPASAAADEARLRLEMLRPGS